MVQLELEGVPQDAVQMLEPDLSVREELELELSDPVLRMSGGGVAQMVIANNSGFM